MNKIKNFFADWSWKEKAWLAFVLIVQTVAWGIQKESAFMLVMTLTSSLNLVLGAKGKVAGLYFAIINSALYAINCMGIPLYGEVMYNLIYSIPVSAIAIFTWKKNMTKDMTRGTPWKLIVQFALPIMAGNLLQQLYNTADTIIVGNFNGQQRL